jgi:hypothetical protein
MAQQTARPPYWVSQQCPAPEHSSSRLLSFGWKDDGGTIHGALRELLAVQNTEGVQSRFQITPLQNTYTHARQRDGSEILHSILTLLRLCGSTELGVLRRRSVDFKKGRNTGIDLSSKSLHSVRTLEKGGRAGGEFRHIPPCPSSPSSTSSLSPCYLRQPLCSATPPFSEPPLCQDTQTHRHSTLIIHPTHTILSS